jgi:hypothetical protein
MDERIHLDDVVGHHLEGADAGALGRVTQVFRDADTQTAEWAVLETPAGSRFVPLQDVDLTREVPRVPYTAALVEQAPQFDPDAGHLTRAEEADLYEHYGIEYDVSSLIQHQTGGQLGGASGQHIGRHRAQGGDEPAEPHPHEHSTEHAKAEHVDGDHLVRPGVLDAGVAPRVQESVARATSEVSFGTGIGGSMMGNASTHSSAGTNANTDLSERDDLTTTTGSERAVRGDAPADAVRGDAMTDIAGHVDDDDKR